MSWHNTKISMDFPEIEDSRFSKLFIDCESISTIVWPMGFSRFLKKEKIPVVSSKEPKLIKP